MLVCLSSLKVIINVKMIETNQKCGIYCLQKSSMNSCAALQLKGLNKCEIRFKSLNI